MHTSKLSLPGEKQSAHEWVFALAGGHANCAQEKSGAMQTLTGGD